MKKSIFTFLVIALMSISLITLSACGENDGTSQNEQGNTEVENNTGTIADDMKDAVDDTVDGVKNDAKDITDDTVNGVKKGANEIMDETKKATDNMVK